MNVSAGSAFGKKLFCLAAVYLIMFVVIVVAGITITLFSLDNAGGCGIVKSVSFVAFGHVIKPR